jgi:hypothetical protein
MQKELRMKGKRFVRMSAAAAIAAALAAFVGIRASAQQGAPPPLANSPDDPAGRPADPAADPGAPANSGVEVLTRGAVHEAYAQPIVFDAVPSPIVPQQPPNPVDEIPPDQKPEGDNVAWIPGYWSWDPDDHRFIWTSGIWRAVPAGLDWVPGYWGQAEGGFQWVSGFWRRNQTAEVSYLPQPPQSLEAGPVGDAPTQDNVWVPGTWIWRPTGYGWRPGYWAQCHPGWIWTPASYVWTPSGYVFVDGYWDYSIARRGVLFAPVAFSNQTAYAGGYAYSPTVAIDSDVFTAYLFCRPNYRAYCYGDYYAPNYFQAGIYPWFSFHNSRFGYDPIFAYYGWHYRNDRGWHDRLVADYRFRREHIEARPPHRFAEMRAFSVRTGGRSPVLAMRFNALAARPDARVRFERVSAVRREAFRGNARELRAANTERLRAESQGAGRGARLGQEPVKMTLPKTSISNSANPGRPLAAAHTPPNMPNRPAGPGRTPSGPRVTRPHPQERIGPARPVPRSNRTEPR